MNGEGDHRVRGAADAASTPSRDVREASPVGVRRASVEDLPAVVLLAWELGRQHEAYDPERFALASFAEGGTPLPAYERFFRRELARPDAALLVAEASGLVVGYAFVRLEGESFLDLSRPSGWIHEVIVAPAARHTGAGHALFAEAIATLRALGAATLRLTAAPANTEARRFFEARGFRATMIEYTLDG